jgi:hypothetical protein
MIDLDPQAATLLTVAGLAPIVSMLSQLIWRTAGHDGSDDAVRARFGPIVAVGVAIALAEVALWVTASIGVTRLDIFQSALTGGVAGLAAIGIHDLTATRAGIS